MPADDACGARQEAALPLELSPLRHFGDQWQHICQTLVSCERLLNVMSAEAGDQTDDQTDDAPDDATDDANDDADHRQQLRRIIRSIEPKKYSKRTTRAETRRSSYHRLKALTQLLMSSNLKRSTSLQSVPVVPDDADDATATLPRLRRRPRINRFYHSLDVADDATDDNSDDRNDDAKGDRSALALELLAPADDSRLTPEEQKKLNRHSCDVTSLLQEAHKDAQRETSAANKQILKYSKKRLRGPYGEMLESMMSTRKEDDAKQSLTFIEELLRETEKQRHALDRQAKETVGAKAAEEAPSITAGVARHLDARTHIVGELYDTEKSFVEQLKDLQDKYAARLRLELLHDHVVDQVFGHVPALLALHARFLEALRHRISSWSRASTVGDLFARFDDEDARAAYVAFVDNWCASRAAVKQLAREKPQFAKFLAEAAREHRSKLSLDELMIAIVQRVPRFELLLKQLLKNTREDHPDHALLQTALQKMHALALCINRAKNDAHDASSLASSLSSVGTPLDVSAAGVQLREACDGLPPEVDGQPLHHVASVSIRKRERVLLVFASHVAVAALKGRRKSEKLEENKLKVLNCFRVEALQLTNNSTELDLKDQDALETDLRTVRAIQQSFLTRLSPHSRHVLEQVLSELALNLSKRVQELKERERNLELLVTTPQTTPATTPHDAQTTPIPVCFASAEKRQAFERALRELKARRCHQSALVPAFLSALPIRKTRAGLQFTCAAATEGARDVWICNSDGFVGQISVLALNWTAALPKALEPTVVSSNGVCNSRITCITCVPRASHAPPRAPSSSESSQSDSECDARDDVTDDTNGGRASSLASAATMWFGTDDASVHVYSCFDAIRIKKNKVKVALQAKVEQITFFRERVFVALANQSVAIFARDASSGAWSVVPDVREGADCQLLVAIDDRFLWTCARASSVVRVRDHELRPLFGEIHVTEEPENVAHMAAVAGRVFVVTSHALTVHVFSWDEPEFARVATVPLQHALHRALLSCEEIIRQHKSACLRVSALLAVKDQLWLGTSAGVILVLDARSHELEIVPNGHTGHVRFLTCVGDRARQVVISGGDGLEAYGPGAGRPPAPGEESGREDSTNHVLLFQIN